MSYATLDDMVARYGLPKLVALTDIGLPQTGELGPAVLQARLDDASAEIDGYLVGRMRLPLADPPAVLRPLCCRIAHFLLLADAASEADQKDVAEARKLLMAVARGDVLLTQVQAPAGAGSVLFSPGRKAWGRGRQ